MWRILCCIALWAWATTASADGLTAGKLAEPTQIAPAAAPALKPQCDPFRPSKSEDKEEGKTAAKPFEIQHVASTAQGQDADKDLSVLRLNDLLVVTLKGNVQAFHICLVASGVDAVLFIDHMPLVDLKPRSTTLISSDQLQITYRLERLSMTSPVWSELMLRNWLSDSHPREVTLGIGPAPSFESQDWHPPEALLLDLGYGGPWLARLFLELAVVLGAVLMYFSAMSVDRSMHTQQPKDGKRTSFSLARTMLMCWVLTTSAVIALAFINTGILPPLDGGMTLLMLASGLTAGTGAVIDQLRKIAFTESQGLWTDLVSDSDGMVLHRLQAVGVNVLLLVVVWQELIASGAIVALDRGWAVLMGISSGVYLYGKTTESVA